MSKGKGINRKKLVPFVLPIFIFSQNPMQRIFEKQTEQKILPKGQRQELCFVCREYRGLEVLWGRIAKGGNTLLGLRGKALSRLRAAAIAQ